jgi:hypothetical protein
MEEEERHRTYMGLLGLRDVDPIGILDEVLNEFECTEGYRGSILLNFSIALRAAVCPEDEVRSELDVEGGAE